MGSYYPFPGLVVVNADIFRTIFNFVTIIQLTHDIGLANMLWFFSMGLENFVVVLEIGLVLMLKIVRLG